MPHSDHTHAFLLFQRKRRSDVTAKVWSKDGDRKILANIWLKDADAKGSGDFISDARYFFSRRDHDLNKLYECAKSRT